MTNHSKNKDKLLTNIKSYIAEKINNNKLSDDQKAHQVIIYSSIFCALIAFQPLPFADIFILTPIQLFMAGLILKIRNKTDQKHKKSNDIIKELLEDVKWVVLGGLAAQYSIIALYKLGLPFLGGFMTIPLVFGFTYSIGKAFDFYVHILKQKNWDGSVEEAKKRLDTNKEELKKIFKKSKAEAKQMWKKLKIKPILKEIKKIYKDKNLNYWDKLKTAFEFLAEKISPNDA